MIFVLVYLRALEIKPVVCKSGGAYRFSRFLFPSQGRNDRKSFYCYGNYFAKKTFIQLLGLRQNVIAGTKWAILSEQYHSILPTRVANHSAGFGSFCRSPSLPYKKLSYRTFCSFATVNYMILQSNLDYPDLDYPDFSIIRTFSLVSIWL